MEKEFFLPPKVAAVHDLSCFGRCALTVCIPTLCAMGAEVVPLPTALLSTHTGGFDDLHFNDLSSSMRKISAHFSRLNISFDAVYTGFLGSAEQIEIVENFIGQCKKQHTGEKRQLILIDPVMGDDGELYSTYTKELVAGMKRLCLSADVLTPNITEACFLTDTLYRHEAMTREEALSFADTLCTRLYERFNCACIALTGLRHIENGIEMIGTFCYQRNNGLSDGYRTLFHSREGLKRHYPGTGDLFASVLLGKMLSGREFFDAAAYASDFTRDTISYSMNFDTPTREGVLFEPMLAELMKNR